MHTTYRGDAVDLGSGGVGLGNPLMSKGTEQSAQVFQLADNVTVEV